MDQLKYELTNNIVSSSKKGGILESASKRVRMIFSVMASPNRIDILRILNSKGPLTYSELKSLAGFRSKKESGKFAYHLRKLLRQSLVALNKAERRYTITNLGKLVLSLARQIEERSIVESGKLYVRTSNHSIEEFNSYKIIQSLVREANMPLELAHKITEEVENKIYKFPNVHLTSSLIREIVNGVLVEHGHEEYRNKLTRLGLPVSDVITLLSNLENTTDSVSDILNSVSQSIFSEFLLNNLLPKDIVDMHLSGDIHLSKSGLWNLLPDTVFINLFQILNNPIDLKGKYLTFSRLDSSVKTNNIEISIPLIISLLSKEVSREIVIEGIVPLLTNSEFYDKNTLTDVFTRILLLSSISTSSEGSGNPAITFSFSLEDAIHNDDDSFISSILDGYKKYVYSTPIPRIGLSLLYTNSNSVIRYSEKISSIINQGGIISITKNNFRSNNGLNKLNNSSSFMTTISLQSLSINLPRIAYQSNRDETYFRARLALMLKPTLSALALRKNIIVDTIRRGNLPLLSRNSENLKTGKLYVSINLIGSRDAVYDILGYSNTDGPEILSKVIKTTIDVVEEQCKKLLPDTEIGITMLNDESAIRFLSLDSAKYGKSKSTESHNQILTSCYSQGFEINGKDITIDDYKQNQKISSLYNEINHISNITTICE